MSTSAQQQPLDPIEAIGNVLVVEHGWRRRRGRQGRAKVRGRCLFHDDATPSADLYLDDGWYYCHACGDQYSLDEVARALGFDPGLNQNDQPRKAGHTPERSSSEGSDWHYHSRFGHPTAVYVYRFPDGRISHYKLRFALRKSDGSAGKAFVVQAADGTWRRPDPFWPIYGDFKLPAKLCIVVVEGEKAQQRLLLNPELHHGILIVALTCGSANDLKDPKIRKTLIDRLQQLTPYRILIWPDNDRPGSEWAEPLYRQARALGLPCALVNVQALGLLPAQGADDFLEAGGSLDAVFEKEFQQAGGYTVDQLIEQSVVTNDERFMLVGSRRLFPITVDNSELLHFRATGDPNASSKIVKRIRNELRSRAIDQGVEVYYRRWHDRARTSLAWRAVEHGHAYYVSAAERTVIRDPHGALLLVPPAEPQFTPKVEESGTRADVEALCELFNLDVTSTAFVECWLACALMGFQTPIMLLRGEAGSGKTTLARILTSILEPTCPALNLRSGRGIQVDMRALIEGLKQSTTVLLDNVSGLDSEAEDLLCQFVTGFSVMHRQLYENKVENLSMQRAIIMTTTNWNVSKGDLASRLLAIRMRPRDGLVDEDSIYGQAQPLMERVRGYLLQACQRVYGYNPNGATSTVRTGIGRVFRGLGYDASRLEVLLASRRGLVANATDLWFHAVVDWYSEMGLRPGEIREVKFEEIKGTVEGFTDSFLPSDQKFAAFLNEAVPRFRDFGFTFEQKRTARQRFWMVRCIREMIDEDDE
jgi:energy-coupling factor transporter ATP-binding protein EcfA2